MFASSFKNGNDDSARNYFGKYCMPLEESINALTDNKSFFDRPVKNKQEAYGNLVEFFKK